MLTKTTKEMSSFSLIIQLWIRHFMFKPYLSRAQLLSSQSSIKPPLPPIAVAPCAFSLSYYSFLILMEKERSVSLIKVKKIYLFIWFLTHSGFIWQCDWLAVFLILLVYGQWRTVTFCTRRREKEKYDFKSQAGNLIWFDIN